MKKGFMILGAILIVGIVIFTGNTLKRQQVLNEFGLTGMSTTQIVEALEAQTISPDALNASINATHLTLTKDGRKYQFQIPDQLFYLSVAPYLTQTHPCANHNLVTCRGELSNQTFEVTIVDLDGTVLFSGMKTAQDNGFFGIWLPRNIEGNINVKYGTYQANTRISTDSTSNTCLTTMQLS